MNATEHFAEGLLKAHQHWNAVHLAESDRHEGPAFTIALSRESGTFGAAIAREVGNRLGWPVYDKELVQHIADDMGVHSTLLESVDERQDNWLSDCLAGFAATPPVSTTGYLHRLLETLLSLGRHGNCVIVGRGATKVLPLATTLRVRVVAPLEQRIQAVQRERNITHKEAAARVETTDRERNRFVASHFGIDPADPANYDLVLNTARYAPGECADIILAALESLRKQTALVK